MITRFAPSPTGPLHLGHAYSALLAQDMARSEGGECLLRIEDIDASRARAGWETQIFEDLRWLGFQWSQPVMRQSERLAIYAATIEDLWKRDWVFACHCSRRDVLDAASAPQEGASPAIGPDGVIYPGTCRTNPRRRIAETRPSDAAFRLNLTQKLADDPTVFSFLETGEGPNGETGTISFTAAQAISDIGDIVLARRDMGTSYHLSVVLDDAAQGITHVTRGQDLFDATKIHVILQHVLGLPTPIYHHHKLIRDDAGKRLAKRDDARAIAKYRNDGATPDDIRALVGLS